nr:glycosyltransferase family 4 protein [Actinomycetota bacterium]
MRRPVRRVAFFEPYPHLSGGGQRTTHLLAVALRDRGIAVTVVVPSGGVTVERLEAEGVPCRVVTIPAALRTFGHRTSPAAAIALPAAWAHLGRTWRRLRPDVVHATNLRGLLLAGPAARVLGIPVVWQVHLSEPQPRLNRLAARLARATVVPSAGALPDLVGVPAGWVTVIANAVPPDAFAVPDRGGTVTAPTLVTSARLTPQKGLDVLIEAITLLLVNHPGVSLTIFGGPQAGYEAHETALHRQVTEAGLSDVVRFAGPVAAPFHHYGDAAIYVQPSRHEILPLAILEAMDGGLPVVASDVGGVADIVEDGRSGLLVPPDDP